MRSVIDRFMNYVRIDTRSVQPTPEVEQKHPSCPNQRTLAMSLMAELVGMCPSDGTKITPLDDGSFLAYFPPTTNNIAAPHIVFAAHVDTYFGCPGGADPRIHTYKGGDLHLLKDDVVIPASDLVGLEGKQIITADGTTLLGGDDKAGVAAIMTFIEDMVTNGREHGPLTIWICTDEEIGEVGVSFLPEGVAQQWDFFWTVDGEQLNVVDVGCFYGAKVDVEFRGNDTHPGVSGHSLKPAHYAACRFIDKLGDVPTPWKTKGEESFIYVPALPAGSASKTIITVYPRTFKQEEIPSLQATIKRVAEEAASKYGVTAVVSEAKVMYVSTEVAINAKRRLLQTGLDALYDFNIKAELHRVRAGTDGAMLNMTYPHIPAPNLGTGARNLHGVREFVVVDELETVPKVLRAMAARYADTTR